MLCVGKAYPVDQYWLDQLARIGSKLRRKAPITKSLHPKKKKKKKKMEEGKLIRALTSRDIKTAYFISSNTILSILPSYFIIYLTF